MTSDTVSPLEIVTRAPRLYAKGVALAGVAGLIALGTAIASRDAHLREVAAKFDQMISDASAGIEERASDPTSPKLGLAFSSSGRKLAGHVAAFECIENRFDLYSERKRFAVYGISGGAEIGAILKLSHLMYLESPGVFEGLTPAQRTKKLLFENQHILRLNNPMQIAMMNGIVDRKLIEEFLKRIFDYRDFIDIPDLYITAKASHTGRYIVFGDHVKRFPVWRAIMGAMARRGTINREPFEGDLLEDTGSERKIPLEEIYSHRYLTHRILIYLGMHTDPELYRVEGNPFCDLISQTNGIRERVTNYAKLKILNRDAASALKRMMRTKVEFMRSLEAHNCLNLDEILACKQDDLIVVAPRYQFVPYLGNGFPINGFYEAVYTATNSALDRYFSLRSNQASFGEFTLRSRS